MTCKFFTIIKSYFKCCCANDNIEKMSDIDVDGICVGRYESDPGDRSPFTFDDLSSTENNSGISSAWSSSSSLDGFDEKRKKLLKQSLHRVKKYQRKLFLPYEEDNRDV